jgi:hypothetical protein
VPYSIDNLHKMAIELGIKRCWFHKGDLPHYDIPKKRIDEILEKCRIVSSKDIVKIIRGHMSKIEPNDTAGPHKEGSLSSSLTKKEIVKILGFEPNIDDDDRKVKNSWGFTYKGRSFGIWDYKGAEWSFYGPKELLAELFPDHIE